MKERSDSSSLKNSRKEKRRKIVIIGAGSAAFGLSSLVWLMKHKDLYGMEMVLVDIAEDRLKTIEKLANILNKAWNSNMTISSSTGYREVLKGSDYIIISVAVDRVQAWQKDIEIALKYNISHVGENGGPGGFIHAARNLSLILPIIEDIKILAPDAFVLNFTNPMQRICTALNKFMPNRFVGICHQIHLGYFILGVAFAEQLRIDLYPGIRWEWNNEKIARAFEISDKAEEVFSIKAAGINHFTWFMDVFKRNDNKSVYKEFIKKMHSLPESFEPLTQEIFKIFGHVPLAGDNHISEYLPYTSDFRSGTFKDFDIQSFNFGSYLERGETSWNKIKDVVYGRKEPDSLLGARSENAEKIIAAFEKNKNSYFESLNMPNNGSISNLPGEAIVDIPAVIGAGGVSGITIGELPKTVAELCRKQLIINEMTVEAVVCGDIKLVYQLMALDPMVNNLDTAIKISDEYIRSNLKYLPGFK